MFESNILMAWTSDFIIGVDLDIDLIEEVVIIVNLINLEGLKVTSTFPSTVCTIWSISWLTTGLRWVLPNFQEN